MEPQRTSLEPDERERLLARIRTLEDRLSHQEQNSAALLAASPDLILFMDVDGEIIDLNGRMARKLQIALEAAKGTNVFNYLPPALAASQKAYAREAIATGGPVHFVDRDQGRVFANRFHPVVDSSGEVTGLAVFVTDITERRQQEEQIRVLLEHSSDALVVIDANGKQRYVSPGAERITGFPVVELEGRAIETLIHPEDINQLMAAWNEVLQYPDRTVTVQYRHIHRTRNWVHSEAIAQNFLDNPSINGVIATIRDISRQVQAEQALRQSEKRFRTLLAGLPQVAVQGYNSDGIVHYWNQASEQLYGYSAEEAIGRNLLDLIIPPAMRPEARMAITAMAESGQPLAPGELSLMRRDGSIVPVFSSHVVLFGYDGLAELFCVDIDLSESKRAAERLRISEERFRLSFELSPVGMVLQSPAFEFLRANDAFCRMIGYSEEELATLTFADITHPEERERDLLHGQRLLAGEIDHYDIEKRYLHKNGEVIWAKVNVTLVRDAEHKPRFFLPIIQDITARKAAEFALEESEQRHRTYLMSTPYGVIAADLEGRIVQVNPSACRLSGYEEHELLAMTITELHFPDYHDKAFDNFQTVIREGRFQGEMPVRVKCGARRWWSITSVNINGQRILGFCNDITERRGAEEALQESENNFRTLFDSMSDLLVVAELDGTILTGNNAVHQTLGYSTQELASMHLIDLLPVEQRQAGEPLLTTMLVDESKGKRFFVQAKNSDLIPMATRVWMGQWNGNNCLFLTCRNLSDEEEAEQRFERLFRRNPALMAVNGMQEGRFIDINETWLNTIGYSREEVVGRSPGELNLFPDTEKQQQAEKELWATGRIANVELQVRCKNGALRHGLFSGETIRSHGQTFILTVMIDITERKRIEAALEKRMLALVQPLDTAEGLAIEDLFNVDELQLFQDQFAHATGVASLITQTDGTPITRPSNFTRLCADIIRQSPIGLANCLRSDALVGQDCIDGPNVRHCLSGGLWDAGAAITVGGRHIANWLIGQVRDESQTEERMRSYARAIQVDETAFIEAFREVPAMSREQFAHIGDALFTLANRLSVSAYQNIQQARFIFERKQAEDALRASEERLQSLFRVVPTGIGVVRDRIFVEVNARVCEMTGYSADELVGQDTRLIYPTQEDYDFVGDEKYRQINEKGVGEVETRWQRKDGTVIDILLASIPLDLADAGKGTIFTALDITERKRAESLLRASEHRYRELVENANSIILRMNSEGILSFFNEYAQRFFGFTAEEVIGQNVVGTIVPATDSAGKNLRTMIAAIGRQPERFATNENENMLRDGTRVWVSWTNRPFFDECGQVSEILCVGNDITERRRTEEEKRHLQAQLSQAQKLEAIGTLAGGIAHDFNNILAAVIGYADIAREDVPDGTFLAKNIDQILKAGHRAKDLVKQILAFSRQTNTEPTVFMPAIIIREAIKLLRPSLPTTIAIEQFIDPKAGPIRIDPTQFHQILMNLCTNAFHAMEGNGGTLSIGLGRFFLDAAALPASAPEGPGEYVVLSVRDTGAGIADTIRSRIFDPFFTTKEAGKGTGMGLSIIHGIIANCGGFITFDSAVGEGTEFKVYLPVTEQEAGRESAVEDQIADGSGHILFVDDETILVEMGTKMLQRLGYRVTAQTSSTEALALFSQDPSAYDLVVTDHTMPGMTGLDLSRRLLTMRPDLPIILCTGYGALLNKEDVQKQGIRQLLLKPLTKKEIASAVKKALHPA